MPNNNILTLLLIVVGILAILMVVAIVILINGNLKNGKKTYDDDGIGWQKYGTVPPEFQDGQAHFGTTSLLKPYHSEYPEDVIETEGGEKTSLLGVSNPHGCVIMRMKTEEEFYVDKDEYLMGKERVRVDYCITSNPAVSRTHARIIKRAGKLYIVDLNATNGTYVNGERITAGNEVPLEVGDRFRLADEEFQIR